jgi:ParB-like chromosome segregation protein Spo0J
MSSGKPKYRKKATRVEVALAKWHGIDEPEPWSIEEIADHLNVHTSTVKDYIYDTELAEEVEEAAAAAQARTRMQIMMKLKDELEKLEEIEEELLQAKDTVISSYTPKNVEVKVDSPEGVHFDGEVESPTISTHVPVPQDYKEVPDTSKLKNVWIQKRKIIQDIEDLMGLEAPDKVEKNEKSVRLERKVYEVKDQGDFPQPEVHHVDEEPAEIDVETPDEV